MNPNDFKKQLADVVASPLRVEARLLAEGLLAGRHRATTKGAGIEFAGHRPYVPGDDLRHLDRHAQLRHGRLLVRQFHTDTERAVHLILDATPSMNYSDEQPGAATKLDVGLLLAAAVAYVAHKSGDVFGLTIISPQRPVTLLPRHHAPLEHVLSLLEEGLSPEPEKPPHAESPGPFSGQRETNQTVEAQWLRVLSLLGGAVPRGAVFLLLSDFLDLSEPVAHAIVQLATFNRTVRAAQVLSRSEVDFPFRGPMRFRDPETGLIVQADAEKAKRQYLEALSALTAPLSAELSHGGGAMVRLVTDEAPEICLKRLLRGSYSLKS